MPVSAANTNDSERIPEDAGLSQTSARPPAPRVVAILPRMSPSAWLHVIKPLVRLHDAGRIRARILLELLACRRDVEQADLMIFSRNLQPGGLGLHETAQQFGIPTIYDLDDNFFELPADSDGYRTEHLTVLTQYLATASLVRVYSQPLEDRVRLLNQNVERVSGPIDLKLTGLCPPRNVSRPVRIVYLTSRQEDELCQVFLPALGRILTTYAGRVEAHFWGPRPSAEFPGIRHHPMIHNYDRYLRRFSAAGFDIGLAPLLDDIFHRSKANTKFREYGACRVAGVYSNVDVYSQCVRDGRTGLLVANEPEAWYQAMVRLIEDQPLRTRVQEQARKDVEEHFSQELFEDVLAGQIERLISRPASGAAQTSPGASAPARPFPVRHLAGLIPRFFNHLVRNGPRRTLNSLRWIATSCWILAYLRLRLASRPAWLKKWFD